VKLSSQNRTKIALEAVNLLIKSKRDILATACPLCKKTFSGVTATKVEDLSEIVAEALVVKPLDKIKTSYSVKFRERARV
jgi:Fe-S oxidoreductase